jgi:hypothetical protein
MSEVDQRLKRVVTALCDTGVRVTGYCLPQSSHVDQHLLLCDARHLFEFIISKFHLSEYLTRLFGIRVALKVPIELFWSHVKYFVDQGRVCVSVLECGTCTRLTDNGASLDHLLLKTIQVELEWVFDCSALFFLLKSDFCCLRFEKFGASTILLILSL